MSEPEVIAGRYLLEGPIGEGGMGAVHRANDRLKNETVAIKRILHTAPAAKQPTAGGFALVARQQSHGPDQSQEERVALANEFKVLASLHHPNIVRVLDYGFHDHQPYFTMSLLDEARTFVEACVGRPDLYKIELLIQLVQALAYLHRRDVVHRDLKPGNVLVSAEGQVKVLDFGVALEHKHAAGLIGTMAYMAPEVLSMKQAQPASDLYAVGVMAYMLFAGSHPYEHTGYLVHEMMRRPPDLTALAIDLDVPNRVQSRPLLQTIIGRLLAIKPDDRYDDPHQLIAELSLVIGLPDPQESAEARESFLIASDFVGRDAELAQLNDALAQAIAGNGSAWLVGGGSGVGKSRLLDELRIDALVAGARVLRGQALAQGGGPYRLWREPLRRLALSAEIDESTAMILKEIVPDIEALLGHDVPDAAPLHGEAGQDRLASAIVDLFAQQQTPLVLLLEDLQWAAGSLKVLQYLNRTIGDWPLLLVGSYRDDEAPLLPRQFSQMRELKLRPLDQTAIKELSVAMLGVAGAHPDVLDLLERETEGNCFFMVEVVRELVAKAGSLGQVGELSFPEHIVTGNIIQRRLSRIPESAQKLLRLAAVAGRDLDLDLLRLLDPDADIENWLIICANAALIEGHDGGWRIAHDKLRGYILENLAAAQQPLLHQQVASAIEQLYPDDPGFAVALADHWHIAGNHDKEIRYILAASKRLVYTDALYAKARRFLEHGLAMLAGQPTSERMQILKLLGDIAQREGDYSRAEAHYEESLELARRLAHQQMVIEILNEWAETIRHQGLDRRAESLAAEALGLAQEIDHTQGLATSFERLGVVALDQANFAAAQEYIGQALEIYQTIDDRSGIALCLNKLGMLADIHGEHEKAGAYFDRSVDINREIGDRRGMAESLKNLARLNELQGRYAAADAFCQKSLSIFRDIGDRSGEGQALNILGLIAAVQQDFLKAYQRHEQSLTIFRDIGNRPGIANSLKGLGMAADGRGDYAAAHQYYEQGLEIFREMGYQSELADTLGHLARVLLHLGHLEAARYELLEGLKIASEIDDLLDLDHVLVSSVHYLVEQGEAQHAAQLAGLLCHHPAMEQHTRDEIDQLRPQLERALGEPAFTTAWERGKALDLPTAVQTLLAQFSDSG